MGNSILHSGCSVPEDTEGAALRAVYRMGESGNWNNYSTHSNYFYFFLCIEFEKIPISQFCKGDIHGTGPSSVVGPVNAKEWVYLRISALV